MPTTRAAKPKDAEGAIRILRRSIVELCVPDHHNDPTTLQKWLENKTIENFHSWLAEKTKFCVVAESDGEIEGVGLVNREGEIQLCYVSPESQRRGFGSAILAALEDQATAWGVDKLHLGSTISARAFYERHGYTSVGESTCGFGLSRCYPYQKSLQTNRAFEIGRAKSGAPAQRER